MLASRFAPYIVSRCPLVPTEKYGTGELTVAVLSITTMICRPSASLAAVSDRRHYATSNRGVRDVRSTSITSDSDFAEMVTSPVTSFREICGPVSVMLLLEHFQQHGQNCLIRTNRPHRSKHTIPQNCAGVREFTLVVEFRLHYTSLSGEQLSSLIAMDVISAHLPANLNDGASGASPFTGGYRTPSLLPMFAQYHDSRADIAMN